MRIWQTIILSLSLATAVAPAFADDRADAKAHYQAGVRAYSSQDYRTAIREFSAAQQLLPADLNNYNLALCYDKLGEAEPAIQYYRTYLDRVPNSDKRAEIEASMARLEAAQRSMGQKQAEEAARQRAEAEARAKAAAEAEARARAEAEAKARAEEEARRQQQQQPPNNGGGMGQNPYGPTPTPYQPPVQQPPVQQPATGDAQLDRVNQIDVNSIRDQRGINPGPAAAAGGTAGAQMQGGPGGPSQPSGQQVTGTTGDAPPKPETPVYKKWWFWAVVAVSAYVIYEIANDGSSSQTGNTGRVDPRFTRDKVLLPSPGMPAGGMTLLRW